MTGMPEQDPFTSERAGEAIEQTALPDGSGGFEFESAPEPGETSTSGPWSARPVVDGTSADGAQTSTQAYDPNAEFAPSAPERQVWMRRAPRIPHLGHLALLSVLTLFGLVAASILTSTAMHFHLFGVSTPAEAMSDIHYLLGSEAVLYLFTFVASLVIFPLFWHKGFFAGLHWNGQALLRRRRILILLSAAFVCYLLALISGYLMPGPTNAPIDKIFRSPEAAWLMFAFGITFAPFFEEMVFRGFLLPAFCTCFDWVAEKASGLPIRCGGDGQPRWPTGALIAAFSVTAIPFAAVCVDPFGHYVLRTLVVLLWALSMAIAWSTISKRSSIARMQESPVDADGHPVWSFHGMVFASLFVSLVFALMHAFQTGRSVGPFLLLVFVSLVLCCARLMTRSLAASVLLHASYNFMLFATMLLGTGGFRHLSNM